ncbi:hypothetical protein Drorol1_Dr00027708 [Drosera rotundifolia]
MHSSQRQTLRLHTSATLSSTKIPHQECANPARRLTKISSSSSSRTPNRALNPNSTPTTHAQYTFRYSNLSWFTSNDNAIESNSEPVHHSTLSPRFHSLEFSGDE